MIISAPVVLAAIEAGVRLARKGNEIIIDKTAERPLALPMGDKLPDADKAAMVDFFDLPENQALCGPGGPYHNYSEAKLIEVYRKAVGAAEVMSGSAGQAASVYVRIDQFNEEAKSKPAVRRLFGTIVEIGVDYAVANPAVFGKNGNQQQLVTSFVTALKDTPFAEGSSEQVVGDLLTSALKTLSDNTDLVDDDQRTRALLGGITSALLEDVDAITSPGKKAGREKLLKRLGSSLLRGGSKAFTENPDLFWPGDGVAKSVVQSTAKQVLEGIKGKEDWFTAESLDLLFQSAMRAVGDNAEQFGTHQVIQEIIRETSTVLAKARVEVQSTDGGEPKWKDLFGKEVAAKIVQAALQATGENMETMLRPQGAQAQFATQALAAMAGGLSKTLAGGGNVGSLFSQKQLLELSQILLAEVARNPEQLLGGADSDPKKTILAQVIASVGRSLGDDPAKLVTGEGLIALARTSLRVALQNSDQLIDLEKVSPVGNLLHQSLKQVATAILETNDPRELVSRETFVEIAQRILPVVSANVTRMVDEEDQEFVKTATTTALQLASGEFKGRINGANLAWLVEQMLTRALWEEVDLNEPKAVALAAMEILRAAPTNPPSVLAA